MKTVLDLRVDNYNIIVTEQIGNLTCQNQTFEEIGYSWSVTLNGIVQVFCTIVYNPNVYNAMDVASNAINWIANQEQTSKQRFEKACQLRAKLMQQ